MLLQLLLFLLIFYDIQFNLSEIIDQSYLKIVLNFIKEIIIIKLSITFDDRKNSLRRFSTDIPCQLNKFERKKKRNIIKIQVIKSHNAAIEFGHSWTARVTHSSRACMCLLGAFYQLIFDISITIGFFFLSCLPNCQNWYLKIPSNYIYR